MFHKTFSILFFGFVFSSLILPPLFPKKIFFILLVLVFILYAVYPKRRFKILCNPFLLIVFFCAYYLFGLTGVQDKQLANQYFFVILSLLLIIPIYKFDISIEESFIYCSIFLSIFILYISAQYFLSILGFELPLASFFITIFKNYELGFIGFRNFGSFNPPMLHFISSPVLFISFSLIFIQLIERVSLVKLLQFVLLFIAIALSGSRGLVLFSLISCVALYLVTASRIRKVIIFIFVGVMSMLALSALINNGVTLFDPSEKSNSVKLGHAISFIDIINGQMLMFGNGLASVYYSIGSQAYKAQTELMILDLIRYFGLLGAIFFYVTLLFPLSITNSGKLNFHKVDINRFIIFFIYLFMASTNPILLNSFGVIVILWYWSSKTQYKQHKI